jgi:hypothetical protein
MDQPGVIAAAYLSRGGSVDIGGAVSRGWALVRDNLWMLMGATVLCWLISIAVPLIGWIIAPVLMGGLEYMFVRRIRGETIYLGDVFVGFDLALVNLILAGLVKGVLTGVGFVLCLLPGIYLAVGYVYALPLILDKKMEFWTALEVSRQVVQRHWWSMFALLIVLMVIVCLGVLACLVGVLVAAPMATAAMMYVYEDLFREEAKVDIIQPGPSAG